MMVNLKSTSKAFFIGCTQHQFHHIEGVGMIILFLTNLLPTTTGVLLFGPLLRVISESIYFLYVVMKNSKTLKILLVWNRTIMLLILFRGGKTSKFLTRRKSARWYQNWDPILFLDYKIPSHYIGTMVMYGMNHLVMMDAASIS